MWNGKKLSRHEMREIFKMLNSSFVCHSWELESRFSYHNLMCITFILKKHFFNARCILELPKWLLFLKMQILTSYSQTIDSDISWVEYVHGVHLYPLKSPPVISLFITKNPAVDNISNRVWDDRTCRGVGGVVKDHQ